MDMETLMAFATYAFVTSITPGPNNTMLLASGVNHGLVRTVPHILGVSLGFGVMVLAVGIGLGSLFLAWPAFQAGLRWLGAGYLMWLAWKIARSRPLEGEVNVARPMTFLQAATFQWINPKCWIMAMGALATYLPAGGRSANLIVIAGLFCLINGPCVGSWAAFGHMLRRLLSNPRANRAFNLAMGLLLLLSLHPLLTEGAR